MRRSNQYSLRTVIEELLKTFRLQDKLNETRVLKEWEKVVGPMVSRHTLHLNIRNKTLFVKVDSAPLRNELIYAREKILTLLNKEAGGTVIEDIVFQ